MESRPSIKGVAYLCFLDEGSWFQGRIITEEKKQYGFVGEVESDEPEDRYHECCFEEVPMFYRITMKDLENKGEKIFKYVMKTNGDNCSLTLSKELSFDTEELLVGEKADKIIGKYFSSEFQGKDCFVCIGQIEINTSSDTTGQRHDLSSLDSLAN